MESNLRKRRGSARSKINGERLRHLRLSGDETLAEVAARAGISHAYLSQIEIGRYPQVSKTVFDSLCRAFQVDPGELELAEVA